MKQIKLSKEEHQKYVDAYKMIEHFIPVYFKARVEREEHRIEKNIYMFGNKEDKFVTYSLSRKDVKLYSSLRKHLRETFKNDEAVVEIVKLFPPTWYLRENIFFPALSAWLVITSYLIVKYTPPFWSELLAIIMLANLAIWGLIYLRLIRLRIRKSLHLLEDMKRVQREIEEILKEDENETS